MSTNHGCGAQHELPKPSASPIQWVVLSIPAIAGIALTAGPIWKDSLPAWILPLLAHRADLLIAVGGIAMVEDAICRAYGLGRLHNLPFWTGLSTLSIGGISKIDATGAGVWVISITMVAVALPILTLTVPSFRFPPQGRVGWVFLVSLAAWAFAIALVLVRATVTPPGPEVEAISLLDGAAAIAALVFVGTLLLTIYWHFETVVNSIFDAVGSRQNSLPPSQSSTVEGDSGMTSEYPSARAQHGETDAEERGIMATHGEDNQGVVAELTRFVESNRNLAQLEQRLEERSSEFDALTFLGISQSEEMHSKVLAWLLDPQGSHDVGDDFLRGFLREAMEVATAAGIYVSDLGDESAFDWSATRVQQEWENVVEGRDGRLDILLINEAEGFLCGIENKIFSGEHSEQLTRYRRALAGAYPDFHRRHVFLSPAGTAPQREEERLCWAPVSYATVLQLVEQISNQGDVSVRDDVGSFLRQYSTTLRRRVVPDTMSNSQALARKIYMEHRDAIDFISANKPDYVEEGKKIVKDAITLHDHCWVPDWEERELVFFRSTDWDQFEVLRTGTGWGNPGSVITFAFDFRPGHLQLICTLGPGTDETVRQKIHEDISRHRGLFSHAGRGLSRSYTRLDVKGPITTDADYDNWDDPAVRAKILDWVTDFAENKFLDMNAVIVESLRECEAQRVGQSSS